MPSLDALVDILLIGVTLAAAVSDHRTGQMPNWLTLTPLPVALLAAGLARGAGGAAAALGSALLCAAVPWVLYRASDGTAIGGGDLKLFATIGALAGPTLGLEIQLGSFCLLALFALIRLAFMGRLLRVLLNATQLLLNPFVPRRFRRQIVAEALTVMRMGPFIAAATLGLVCLDASWGGAP